MIVFFFFSFWSSSQEDLEPAEVTNLAVLNKKLK